MLISQASDSTTSSVYIQGGNQTSAWNCRTICYFGVPALGTALTILSVYGAHVYGVGLFGLIGIEAIGIIPTSIAFAIVISQNTSSSTRTAIKRQDSNVPVTINSSSQTPTTTNTALATHQTPPPSAQISSVFTYDHNTLGNLTKLPQELVIHIFSCLSSYELLQLSTVCRSFKVLCDDKQLWHVFARQLPITQPKSVPDEGWKTWYGDHLDCIAGLANKRKFELIDTITLEVNSIYSLQIIKNTLFVEDINFVLVLEKQDSQWKQVQEFNRCSLRGVFGNALITYTSIISSFGSKSDIIIREKDVNRQWETRQKVSSDVFGNFQFMKNIVTVITSKRLETWKIKENTKMVKLQPLDLDIRNGYHRFFLAEETLFCVTKSDNSVSITTYKIEDNKWIKKSYLPCPSTSITKMLFRACGNTLVALNLFKEIIIFEKKPDKWKEVQRITGSFICFRLFKQSIVSIVSNRASNEDYREDWLNIYTRKRDGIWRLAQCFRVSKLISRSGPLPILYVHENKILLASRDGTIQTWGEKEILSEPHMSQS